MPTVTIPDVRIVLEHVDCCACGLHFAVDSRWVTNRRDDHKGFKCPNGCALAFNGPSEAEKKTEEMRRLWENERSYARSVNDRLENEKRAHSSTKGQLTKTRKRAAAALCPVEGCGRSFTQLRQHLTKKHPDFVAPGAVEHHTHP